MTEIEALKERLRPSQEDGPECPFCGRYPYHYVDVGVGMVRGAVNCCDLGIILFEGDEQLAEVVERMAAALNAIERLEAENAKLREEIRQIYVDATEQYSDWCNMGPIENEARDWAFDLSQCALEALKG